MAKQVPIIELERKTSTSKVLGILDIKDGKDIIIVDGEEHLFDDIKKYFYGGIIQLDNNVELEV